MGEEILLRQSCVRVTSDPSAQMIESISETTDPIGEAFEGRFGRLAVKLALEEGTENGAAWLARFRISQLSSRNKGVDLTIYWW